MENLEAASPSPTYRYELKIEFTSTYDEALNAFKLFKLIAEQQKQMILTKTKLVAL